MQCALVCVKSLYACRCGSWLRSVTKLNTSTKSEAMLSFPLERGGMSERLEEGGEGGKRRWHSVSSPCALWMRRVDRVRSVAL